MRPPPANKIILRSGPAPVLFANPASAKRAKRLPWFRERKPASPARRRITLAAILLAIVGLYAIVGLNPIGAGGGTSASAIDIPGLSPCDWLGQMQSAEEPPPPESNYSFVSGFTSAKQVDELKAIAGAQGSALTPGIDQLAGQSFSSDTKYRDVPGFTPTVGEWYGFDRLAWKAYPMESMGSQCGAGTIMNSAGTMIADTFFRVTTALFSAGQQIISWALSVDAFTPFIDAMTTAVDTLKDGLFLEYLAPVVLIATIWLAWQGLVKKRTRESIQGMVWTISAGALSLVFLTNTKVLAQGTNDFVQGLTSGIVSTMTSATDANVGMCAASGPDATQRQTNCSLWQTFVYTPWVAGQLGDFGAKGVVVKDGPPVVIPGHGESRDIGLVFLDVTTLNHDDAIAASHQDPLKERTQTRKDQWQAFVKTMTCETDDYNSEEAKACPARSDAQPAFTGDGFGRKLQIALLALVAFLIGAVPLVFLSFTMVVFQITFVFLMITSPIFLLLGIHPGFGRKIAMGWLEMVLANCLKRIATAVLIGILLIVLQAAIASTVMSWLGQVFLMAAASIAILMYRKKMLDKVSQVNLGGDGGQSLQSGNAAGKAKRLGRQAVTKTAGAVGSGVGAGREGAGMWGIVGASAVGAMMGRGASPLVAARSGNSRGATAARRKEAELRAQEEATPQGASRAAAQKLRAEESTVDDIHSTWGVDPSGSRDRYTSVLAQHREAGTRVATAVGKYADEMNRMASDMGVETRARLEKARSGPSRPSSTSDETSRRDLRPNG